MARILIAGAGYLGTRLADALAGDGHQVYALRHGRCAFATSGVQPLQADLTDSQGLRDALPRQLDYAIFTAAAKEHSEEAYQRVYVEGLASLLTALAAQPLKRFLFTSSTAVYTQSAGEWVDETSEAASRHFSGRTLLAAEALLKENGTPYTTVRLAGIYGPERERSLEALLSPTQVPPVYANRIHVCDGVGILRFLLTLGDAASCYIGADSEPVTQQMAQRWLYEYLGRSLLNEANQTSAPSPLRGHKRCSNKLIRAAGYRFLYPTFREGFTDLLRRRQTRP